MEINPTAALIATRDIGQVICGDIASILPAFDDGSFDCVLVIDIPEHLVDPIEVLRVATAKLRRGDYAVISVPNVSHWTIIAGLLQGRWDYSDRGILDRIHLRFCSAIPLLEMVANRGLDLVSLNTTRLLDSSPPPAILDVSRKPSLGDALVRKDLDCYQFVLVCRISGASRGA